MSNPDDCVQVCSQLQCYVASVITAVRLTAIATRLAV
jgi:hypothetical protein